MEISLHRFHGGWVRALHQVHDAFLGKALASSDPDD
jgi:hypothetical protein